MVSLFFSGASALTVPLTCAGGFTRRSRTRRPRVRTWQTIVMSQQPAQDQVKAAIARLEVELASDGVVLRSQPPELPPGDDAPLLGLGSSHHGSRSLAPSEHELSRRLAEQSQRRPPVTSWQTAKWIAFLCDLPHIHRQE